MRITEPLALSVISKVEIEVEHKKRGVDAIREDTREDWVREEKKRAGYAVGKHF